MIIQFLHFKLDVLYFKLDFCIVNSTNQQCANQMITVTMALVILSYKGFTFQVGCFNLKIERSTLQIGRFTFKIHLHIFSS